MTFKKNPPNPQLQCLDPINNTVRKTKRAFETECYLSKCKQYTKKIKNKKSTKTPCYTRQMPGSHVTGRMRDTRDTVWQRDWGQGSGAWREQINFTLDYEVGKPSPNVIPT